MRLKLMLGKARAILIL